MQTAVQITLDPPRVSYWLIGPAVLVSCGLALVVPSWPPGLKPGGWRRGPTVKGLLLRGRARVGVRGWRPWTRVRATMIQQEAIERVADRS